MTDLSDTVLEHVLWALQSGTPSTSIRFGRTSLRGGCAAADTAFVPRSPLIPASNDPPSPDGDEDVEGSEAGNSFLQQLWSRGRDELAKLRGGKPGGPTASASASGKLGVGGPARPLEAITLEESTADRSATRSVVVPLVYDPDAADVSLALSASSALVAAVLDSVMLVASVDPAPVGGDATSVQTMVLVEAVVSRGEVPTAADAELRHQPQQQPWGAVPALAPTQCAFRRTVADVRAPDAEGTLPTTIQAVPCAIPLPAFRGPGTSAQAAFVLAPPADGHGDVLYQCSAVRGAAQGPREAMEAYLHEAFCAFDQHARRPDADADAVGAHTRFGDLGDTDDDGGEAGQDHVLVLQCAVGCRQQKGPLEDADEEGQPDAEAGAGQFGSCSLYFVLCPVGSAFADRLSDGGALVQWAQSTSTPAGSFLRQLGSMADALPETGTDPHAIQPAAAASACLPPQEAWGALIDELLVLRLGSLVVVGLSDDPVTVHTATRINDAVGEALQAAAREQMSRRPSRIYERSTSVRSATSVDGACSVEGIAAVAEELLPLRLAAPPAEDPMPLSGWTSWLEQVSGLLAANADLHAAVADLTVREEEVRRALEAVQHRREGSSARQRSPARPSPSPHRSQRATGGGKNTQTGSNSHTSPSHKAAGGRTSPSAPVSAPQETSNTSSRPATPLDGSVVRRESSNLRRQTPAIASAHDDVAAEAVTEAEAGPDVEAVSVSSASVGHVHDEVDALAEDQTSAGRRRRDPNNRHRAHTATSPMRAGGPSSPLSNTRTSPHHREGRSSPQAAAAQAMLHSRRSGSGQSPNRDRLNSYCPSCQNRSPPRGVASPAQSPRHTTPRRLLGEFPVVEGPTWAFKDVCAALEQSIATVKHLKGENDELRVRLAELESDVAAAMTTREEEVAAQASAAAAAFAARDGLFRQLQRAHDALARLETERQAEVGAYATALEERDGLLRILTAQGRAAMDMLRLQGYHHSRGPRQVHRDVQTVVTTMQEVDPADRTGRGSTGSVSGDGVNMTSSANDLRAIMRLTKETEALRSEVAGEGGAVQGRWKALLDKELQRAEERHQHRYAALEAALRRQAEEVARLQADKKGLVMALRGLDMARKEHASELFAERSERGQSERSVSVSSTGTVAASVDPSEALDPHADPQRGQESSSARPSPKKRSAGTSSGGVASANTAAPLAHATLERRCKGLEKQLERANIELITIRETDTVLRERVERLTAQNVTLKHALAMVQKELTSERNATRSLQHLTFRDSDVNKSQKDFIVKTVLHAAGSVRKAAALSGSVLGADRSSIHSPNHSHSIATGNRHHNASTVSLASDDTATDYSLSTSRLAFGGTPTRANGGPSSPSRLSPIANVADTTILSEIPAVVGANAAMDDVPQEAVAFLGRRAVRQALARPVLAPGTRLVRDHPPQRDTNGNDCGKEEGTGAAAPRERAASSPASDTSPSRPRAEDAGLQGPEASPAGAAVAPADDDSAGPALEPFARSSHTFSSDDGEVGALPHPSAEMELEGRPVRSPIDAMLDIGTGAVAPPHAAQMRTAARPRHTAQASSVPETILPLPFEQTHTSPPLPEPHEGAAAEGSALEVRPPPSQPILPAPTSGRRTNSPRRDLALEF